MNLVSFVIAIGATICATFGVPIQMIIGKINGMDIKPSPIFLLFLSNTPNVAKPFALDLQPVNNMKTLRDLKPKGFFTPVATYAEYKGKRYLIADSTDWYTAEKIACDFQQAFGDAGWYTTDRYDSTCIDGRTKQFKSNYNS